MKKLLIVTAIILGIVFSDSVQAATDNHQAKNAELRQIAALNEDEHSLYVTIDQAGYFVDGQARQSKLSPYIVDGRTYIPLSLLEEAFGVSMTWDTTEKSGLFIWRGSTFKMSLSENKMYYAGQEVGDLSADITEDKGISVPLAEVMNALGISYQWIADTSSVFIYQINKDILAQVQNTDKNTTQKMVVEEYNKYLSGLEEESNKAQASEMTGLLELAKSRLGMPYVGGKAGPYAFDCSGYVHWVLTNAGYKSYQRGSSQSLYALCTPVSREELKVGDILFFTRTYSSRNPITHCAIYIGDGQMIHAAGNRVQTTPLSDRYWTKHFYGFGRMK